MEGLPEGKEEGQEPMAPENSDGRMTGQFPPVGGEVAPGNPSTSVPSLGSPSLNCMSPNTQMMPPPSPNTTKLMSGVLRLGHEATNIHQGATEEAPEMPSKSFALSFGSHYVEEAAAADRDSVACGDGHRMPDIETPETRTSGQSGAPGKCDHFEQVFKDISSSRSKLMQKWEEILGESESFELMCPVRLDAVLNEARAIEQDLILQKGKIVDRLQQMHKTLQQSWEC